MVTTPLCGRVGCGEPAVGVLLIASQECEAWLVELSHESAPEGVALCAHHADRIRVPVGWSLHDERAATPAAKRRRTKKTPRSPVAEPESVDVPETPETEPAPPVATPVPEEATSAPHRPSDTPVHVDEVAAAIPDDDPRHLQVVPPQSPPEATVVFEESGQGALWVPPSRDHDELEASDATPLLKRAFRVVREE